MPAMPAPARPAQHPPAPARLSPACQPVVAAQPTSPSPAWELIHNVSRRVIHNPPAIHRLSGGELIHRVIHNQPAWPAGNLSTPHPPGLPMRMRIILITSFFFSAKFFLRG